MMTGINPYSQMSFGKSAAERKLSSAVNKALDVTADVFDDDDKINKENVVKGGAAATAGIGVARLGKAAKLANRGGDVIEVAGKLTAKKTKSLANSPILRRLGGFGSLIATGLGLASTGNLVVNLANKPD